MKHKYLLIICSIMEFILCVGGVGYAQQNTSGWSDPIDITQPSSTEKAYDGVLLCDQYQNVHLWWIDCSEDVAAIFYRNDINGEWSVPIDVLAVPQWEIVGLQAAISETDDVVHLVWRSMSMRGNVYYSQAPLRSAGDVRAWLSPRIVAYSTDLARIQVDTAGVVYIVYGVSDEDGTWNEVFHIKSTDGGLTWSDPVLDYATMSPVPSVIRPEIDIDSADRIHMGVTVWSWEYGAYSKIGYLRSSDGGRTWSEYRTIDYSGITFPGTTGIRPYTFGENQVHLTWHDPRRMHQWSSDGGDTWSDPIEIMHLGAAFGGPNKLVKDSAGTLHVVTAVASGVYSAAWYDTQWGYPEQIDDRHIDPHGQNIVVCQGNQLHVVYFTRVGNPFWDNTVWYASRQVEAPHIERQPLPTATPQPIVAVTPDTLATLQSSAMPVVSPADTANSETFEFSSAATAPSQIMPVLMSAVPVLALLAATFVLRHRVRG